MTALVGSGKFRGDDRSRTEFSRIQLQSAASYFLPFFADFFGEAFFEGVGFFAVGLAPPFFAEKAVSQPSEYF